MSVILPLHLILALQAAPVVQVPEFTASDVADAVERITGRRAHLSQDIRLLAGGTMVGSAVTMRIVRDDSASLMAEGLAAIRVVETADAGSVIVVAMDGDKSYAVFGATFGSVGASRGLAGFLIEGAVRGLAGLSRLGFPTFARGTVAGSAGGHYRLEATNVPVWIDGVQISPGDLVVGDLDGVAVVPRERIPDVLAMATALRSQKEELLPLIAQWGSYTKAVEEYRRRRGGSR